MARSDNDIACPSCGSDDADRIARGVFDKLVLKKRKYVCRKCRTKYATGNPSHPALQETSSGSQI